MIGKTLTFFIVAMAFYFASPGYSPAADNPIYSELLSKYVSGPSVDYTGLKAEEGKLNAFCDILAGTDPGELPEKERLAYYINAYNAWTLKLILSNWPVNSIKDIGPFWSAPWKIEFVRIGDKTVSLDYIENAVLRPQFKDPRIHFAINCASTSCPPLRGEPYEGGRIDAQLDDAAGRFINDGKSNYLKDKKLYLSKIFDWFSEDFGGEGGVLAFIRKYAQGDLALELATSEKPEIVFLDYDWSLNGK